MRSRVRCTNMNHGRTNAPVKYCPSCGDTVNQAANTRCDAAKHADQRKSRNAFCVDCGKSLSST
jgi:hypothetical protein